MALLEELKEKLNINWAESDESLTRCLDRGKAFLNGITGIELDYETNIFARSLLLDYARYDFNNAAEYFEENFHSQLLRLSIQESVKERESDDTV